MRCLSSVLALVALDHFNTRDESESSHALQLPRRCILGMLMEKISPIENLVQVQLRNELHVGACLNIGLPHFFWTICPRPIEMLPGREVGTHR